MGRITVFTIDNCTECLRIKDALDNRSVPYTEINISKNPDRKADMISLSNELFPPVVFFNDRFVGAAKELLSVLSDWEKEASFSGYDTARERYELEIQCSYGSSDVRLTGQSPQAISRPQLVPEERNEITLPDGTCMSAGNVTRMLMDGLPRSKLTYRNTEQYKDCFTGSDAVCALMRIYDLPLRESAVWFARDLQNRGVLHHAKDQHHTFDDDSSLYRLHPYHETRSVLNSFVLWRKNSHSAMSDPVKCLNKLIETMTSIIHDSVDATGAIDYSKAKVHPLFSTFEEDVCKLQTIDMRKMNVRVKLAFSINVYNLMVRHALVKCEPGPIVNPKFFDKVQYNIGGIILSLNDIEHGILRANSKPPKKWSVQFSSSDKRKVLALPGKDRRVHFALNRGTVNSPPVYTFTEEAVDQELRVVAELYCSSQDNITIDERSHSLTLPKMIKWFLADFGLEKSKVPIKLLPCLSGERKQTLQRMVRSKQKIKVRFTPYDWTVSSKVNELGPSSQRANLFREWRPKGSEESVESGSGAILSSRSSASLLSTYSYMQSVCDEGESSIFSLDETDDASFASTRYTHESRDDIEVVQGARVMSRESVAGSTELEEKACASDVDENVKLREGGRYLANDCGQMKLHRRAPSSDSEEHTATTADSSVSAYLLARESVKLWAFHISSFDSEDDFESPVCHHLAGKHALGAPIERELYQI